MSFDYVSGYMKAELAFPLASISRELHRLRAIVDNPEPGSIMG